MQEILEKSDPSRVWSMWIVLSTIASKYGFNDRLSEI